MKYLFVVVLTFVLNSQLVYQSNVATAAGKKKNTEFLFGQNQKMRVSFRKGRIAAYLQPRKGDGYYRFASWTLRDWKKNYKKIKRFNRNRKLKANQYVAFPFKYLNDHMQSMVLQALFSNDSAESEGWAHRVKFSRETISLISGLFARKNVSPKKLIKYNKLKYNGTRIQIGDTIVIPWDWVRPELDLKPIAVRKPLYIKKDRYGNSFACYRLLKGESLYSSVVVRFTGRTLAEDVTKMANALIKLNKIKDSRSIWANTEIIIPIEWLSEAYLVVDRPIMHEEIPDIPQKTTTKYKNRSYHVIIDPGHGGIDPGAVIKRKNGSFEIFEDETVYDISLRLSEILKKNKIDVYLTIEDPNQKTPIRQLARIKDDDERVMVTPVYNVKKSDIGINMRIYLINSIYYKLIQNRRINPQNIIMMSIHCDSLHDSISGATVYFPDKRLRADKFRLVDRVYRMRREYRKKIMFYNYDNKRAARLSENFGKQIIKSFKKAGLKTHKVFAVRGYFYRWGKRTLPAILRYSKIPKSILVEVGNMNNTLDRKAFLKHEYRQKVADTLAKSVISHFSASN